jgi:hypothetical protein
LLQPTHCGQICGQQTGNNLERITWIQTPTLILPNSQKTNPMDAVPATWEERARKAWEYYVEEPLGVEK